MRDYNLKSVGEEVDLRDNMIEHNGFDGEVYWEAYYELCQDAPELKALISGAHAAMTLNIANSYLDVKAIKESSTATVEAVISATRSQYVYERIGLKPDRLANLLRLYLASLR